MNENIIPFNYRRLADKKRAFPVFFTLIGISAFVVVLSMLTTKYQGLISLAAIGTMTASVMIYVRYIISDYTYSVCEGENNQSFLIFTKLVGKRQSMMGCIPLYSIKSIEKFTKTELKKQKVEAGVHKYNFAPSFSPDVVYVIKAQTRTQKYFAIIEGTDELRERLLEYSRYALFDETESDDYDADKNDPLSNLVENLKNEDISEREED